MPRLSIITRTLDRPRLLERTRDSILAQTDSDWEWVIVTPELKPATKEVLDARANELGDRMRILEYAAARPGMRGMPLNHGVERSAGEWVTILDDDDTWEPDFIEEMMKVATAPPAEIGGVICQTRCLEEGSVEEGLAPGREYTMNPGLRGLTLAQLAVVNQFCIHAFVYRRSAWQSVGGYPEDYPVLEDWHFNLRFLEKFDVAVLPRVLTTYHQRPSVVAGPEANSLFAELDGHKFYESKLINDLLRQDLKAGVSGLGSLMASAAQNRLLQDRLHRIEGKVRAMSDKVGKIDSRTKELKSRR